MKAVLISGSIRQGSYNSAIVQFINEYLNINLKIESVVFKGIDKLPFFSPDRDEHTLQRDNSPKEVREFRAALKDTDMVIISTQEYAFEISGVLKNALDWIVSSGEFVDKNVAVISSSTSRMGGESAYKVLVKLLKVLSAKVFEKDVLNIGHINKKIDEKGNISKELQKDLEHFVEDFLAEI